MGWVKLDDGFMLNRKSRRVGANGRMLYVASLCFCAQQENDGRFPSRDLAMLAAMAEVEPAVADILVDADLWRLEDDEFVIPDYLQYNPSRAQAVARRESDRERQRKSRSTSQPESRRDTERPVPSRPPGHISHSSTTVLTSDPPESGDDDEPVDIPDGTWEQYAVRKLSLTNGIKNPGPWKRKVARNAQLEMAADARSLLVQFEATATELATALLAKERGESWNLTRRKEHKP